MTKTKYRGGRPIVVLTDEQIKEVEEISAYLTCEQIADYFGIDTDTFLAIRKRQSEVFRCYKKGKAKKILAYAQKLETKAMGHDTTGDTASLIFFLKTQAGWREKKEEEIKNEENIGAKVTYVIRTNTTNNV